MKANFALSLSFDGIRLLHRAAGGWRRVGEVDLEDRDLQGALRLLRKTALGLEPSGLRTKLIIPDSQIKYLVIETGDASMEDRRIAAQAALDGATPYAVSDLAFDISPDGEKTHVAAVAKETLSEAEAFAVQHRFSPISTVAVPETAEFLGEPFFGPTVHAGTIMEAGDAVEPDGIAVVVIGDIAPSGQSDPAPVVEPPSDEVDDSDATDDSDAHAPQDAQDTRPDDTDDTDETDETDDSHSDSLPADEAPTDTEQDTAEETSDTIVDDAEDMAPIAELDHDSDATDTPPDTGPAPPAPRFSPVPDAQNTADTDTTDPAEDDEDDTADAAQIGSGFASRRTPDGARAPSLGGVTRELPQAPTPETANILAATVPEVEPAAVTKPLEGVKTQPAPKVAPQNPAPRKADAPDLSGPEAAAATLRKPSLPLDEHSPNEVVPVKVRSGGFFSRRKKQLPPILSKPPAPSPAEKAAAKAAQRSERQRMTVFGARKVEPAGAIVVGGKPRYLGLILTAVLLVFLAGVAAWASVFMDNGLARLFGARAPDVAITEEELAPEPEVGTEILTAALDPILDMAPPPTLLQPEPVEIPTVDLESAQEFYAVTGIWTIPPNVTAPPQIVPLDNLYIASIDRAGPSFDAVALPSPRTFDTDRSIEAPSSPAPAGTRFSLDARGLVIPTPEGALSPDGITVFLGRPPAVPPAIPERATTEVVQSNSALAAFRPRLRPDNLIEDTERRNLGGVSLSELRKFRPQMRPETQKVEEEKDETPTAQAVAASLRPDARPRNFDRIVSRAQTRRQDAPAAQPQQREVAAVAPRTVTPSIPSRTSVTKQATVKNAINLRKVNLMGVFGKPSSRSALVRLSNGRFMKVKVGDRIDGGRVSAIGESELRYQKNGRNITLKMPRT